MAEKGIISKELLKRFTIDFANLIFGLDIDPERLELLDTQSQRIEERRADFLARVRPRDVVNFIVQRLKILTGEDQGLFRRYFGMLEVLSTNRDLKGELKGAEKMLIELDRTQMPSYELGLERGLERGLQQGLEKGLERGMEKGMEKARLAMARNLIALGKLDDATIAQVAELPLTTVERLRREAEGND